MRIVLRFWLAIGLGEEAITGISSLEAGGGGKGSNAGLADASPFLVPILPEADFSGP
jgi:hypothetical protein